MDKSQYNNGAPQQPMYEQPGAPNNMAYQNNGSNQQLSEKSRGYGPHWANSFWDCFSPMDTCCMAYWCPCILYGKTQARNEGDKESSGFTMMCCGWFCLTYCAAQGILQGVTRHSYRKQRGIEGSGFMDCLGACCCPCCGLVQEEKESLLRENNYDAKTKQQYQAPPQMHA